MPFEDPKLFQFPHICVVEASAGSGKTYALAQRYIQLLMHPALPSCEAPLKNILAITFSNKAAFEMKERILFFLKKIALDQFSSEQEKKEILLPLGMDEACAQKKAYRCMEEIIRNYNFFQVKTIDSFINAILSGCAFKLNLSAAFKIKTNPQEYLAYSLDKLIDRAAEDKKITHLFNVFLRQYLFLENRTGWFPKKDILEVVASLYAATNIFGGRFLRSSAKAEDIIQLKKKILRQIQQLEKQLPQGTYVKLQNALSDFLKERREAFDLGDLSIFFQKDDIPVSKGSRVTMPQKTLWKKIRRDLAKLAEEESGFVFNAYIDIFYLVLENFRQLANKEDILFLDELNMRTRALFDEKTFTVPELYYRLATRLKHFLIDEFQDTSRLQWRNLFIMVEEALASDGSLFYVGDKKQAIYRFRGGDVELFDAVKKKYKDFSLLEWPLQKNYRSQKEIVEFANSVFCPNNLLRFLEKSQEQKKYAAVFSSEEIQDILLVFQEVSQEFVPKKDKGYVRIEYIDSKTKEQRNELVKEKLLSLLEALKQRYAYKNIALLTRQNDDVELLTEWLLEKEIPVESEKTLNVRNNAYIKELICFLKFLNSPIDNLSFASFILGEIFASASKIKTDQFHDFIFDLRKKSKKERNVYLYREFRRVFPEVWEALIEEFFKNVGFVPLYELTISLLRTFRCLENFPEYQGFFMKFLELIKKKEDDKAGIAAFLDFLQNAPEEELYVEVSETDAVKILTIHKAKGLGFPVVVIPFLEFNIKVDPDVTYAQDAQLVLRRISEKYRSFSAPLEALYRQEYKKVFIDELNSIYVAITRPQEELYIFIPKSTRRGPNRALGLIPEGVREKGHPSDPLKEKSGMKEIPPLEIPISQYKDWVQFLKDEFMEESLLLNHPTVLRGEAIHAVLSFIGNLNKQNKERIFKESLEKALLLFPEVDDWKDIQMTVRRLIEDKKFKPFFFLREGLVYQEKEVVDIFGKTKRIDRLIVNNDEVCVVDYKSSKEEGFSYHSQIQEYKRLATELYPAKKVRGFLIYLNDLSLEEIHG